MCNRRTLSRAMNEHTSPSDRDGTDMALTDRPPTDMAHQLWSTRARGTFTQSHVGASFESQSNEDDEVGGGGPARIERLETRDPDLRSDENIPVRLRERIEGRLHLHRPEDQRVRRRLEVAEANCLRDEALLAAGHDVIQDRLRERNAGMTAYTVVCPSSQTAPRDATARKGSAYGAPGLDGTGNACVLWELLQERHVEQRMSLRCCCRGVAT